MNLLSHPCCSDLSSALPLGLWCQGGSRNCGWDPVILWSDLFSHCGFLLCLYFGPFSFTGCTAFAWILTLLFSCLFVAACGSVFHRPVLSGQNTFTLPTYQGPCCTESIAYKRFKTLRKEEFPDKDSVNIICYIFLMSSWKRKCNSLVTELCEVSLFT